MIASEGRSVQLACRVLGVSESGYYDWPGRAPSPRSVRQAWLTDLIREIHVESFQVYGSPRVHAELPLGRGIVVGHNTVALLTRRNANQGPAQPAQATAEARHAHRGGPGRPRLRRT
ncbi:IS3 family transposase [Saccharothrix deserti]|uniref:IS3 family transposase n=1 Tax=Saccharothrix deserti TaxID=2593674 RepID=UPI00131EA5D1|nr:IS3 family transposase [Saccharothrix deserti]